MDTDQERAVCGEQMGPRQAVPTIRPLATGRRQSDSKR